MSEIVDIKAADVATVSIGKPGSKPVKTYGEKVYEVLPDGTVKHITRIYTHNPDNHRAYIVHEYTGISETMEAAREAAHKDYLEKLQEHSPATPLEA
jgi:hypothetical protein